MLFPSGLSDDPVLEGRRLFLQGFLLAADVHLQEQMHSATSIKKWSKQIRC